LVVTAGCKTTVKPPPRVTPLERRLSLPTDAPVAAAPSGTQAATAPSLAIPPGASTTRAAAAKAIRPGLPASNLADLKPTQNGWVSLSRWASLLGLDSPTPLDPPAGPAYGLSLSKGSVVIPIGKHQARWDGVELWLGFAPQLLRGEPHLHQLDLEKSLSPLLAVGAPLVITNRMVVIDPGHGGENPGAKCLASEHYEKEFTLDWALRLAPLLEANGWQVRLTRTNDADLSLSERVAVAEFCNAALFVSLHFNSSTEKEDLAGLETYCLTPTGMPSNVLRTSNDDLSQVFPNNAHDEDNLRLAFQLHRAMVQRTAEPDRGVRHARFMGVLRAQNRPAVLLEGGYLSNPREARLIASPEYRQQLAEAVAEALAWKDNGHE
jgi:N-acetylmuramoyl-L-alanine amidase